MKGHHKLEVWKRSINLVTEIYKVTEGFPKSEMYGLTQQMRRAAVSIPSNIAEGAARNSIKEFQQFLSVAQGSIAELETQLFIAVNLKFIKSVDNLLRELDEISKMLLGLSKSLRNSTKGAIS